MLNYIFLFLLTCILGIIYSFTKRKELFYLLLIPFALLPGLRLDIGGSDYFLYEEAYNNYLDKGYVILFEPGYNFIMYLGNIIGISFNTFLCIITIISSIILFSVINAHTKFVFIAILLYLAKLYIFYNFVLIRQMIAIPIVWYALLYFKNGNYYKFLIMIVLASCFHSSAIIFLFLFLIRNVIFSNKMILLGLFFAVIIAFINRYALEYIADSVPYIGMRLVAYLDRDNSINPFNFIEIALLLIIATSYKESLKKKVADYEFYYALLFLSAFLLIAFFNIDVFKRIRDYFIISYITIIPGIILVSKKGLSRYLMLFIIIAYLSFLYIRSIYIFDTTTGGVGNLIPYHSIL